RRLPRCPLFPYTTLFRSYSIGTLGLILQHVAMPDASLRVLIQGRARLRLWDFRQEDGIWTAAAEELVPAEDDPLRVQALQRIVRSEEHTSELQSREKLVC